MLYIAPTPQQPANEEILMVAPIPPVPALPVTPAPGRMNVDFEQRVDFARLRDYRLSRAMAALEASDLGALLVFDNNNIRYLTGVAIGEWTRDKLCRYALYTRTGELFLWDFGSAAVHHRMYCPWLKPDHCIASYTTMRGATAPEANLPQRAVAEIKDLLAETGVAGLPVGVDFAEISTLFELQRQGVEVRDGQQVMLDARQIKSADEIALLSTAAAMVDGVYQEITDALKPGVRENEIVALANKRLYEMGSDDVESINAVSGERCNPHPHNFSDRMIRPGEQAFFDIMHSFNGYRTCYYRTFSVGSSTQAQRDAYARASEWMQAALDAIKPGVSTDQVARLWPTAQDIGLPDEKTAFGLQFGHGLGLALHERPIISRLSSLDAPMEIQKGMVFAVETYCPAADGVSAARLEEEVVVVDDGVQIITRFPSAELFVTNPY
jgi:Xaa-Pro dipeptidase